MVAPQRVTKVRTAKHATERRVKRKARARNAPVMQFCAALCAGLCLLMLYVMLTARLTSLNYAVARAQRERAQLQGEVARLDDRLATLRSDERLGAIAVKLHMHEPQTFAMVTLPHEATTHERSRLAFLAGIAGIFGSK
jgi:hypothetical protein